LTAVSWWFKLQPMPAFVSPPCGPQSEEAQNMTRKSWLTLTAGLALASPPLSSQTPVQVDTITQPPLEAGNRPGLAAPEFTLKSLAGPEASLSDYKGRPALINFWASWCKPCRSEMPDIVAAYRAHQESGLEVLAINLTDQEGMKDIRKFVAEFQMPFPVLLDERGRVRRLYALIGVPTSVRIGSDGVVRVANHGRITKELLERVLAEILPAREAR